MPQTTSIKHRNFIAEPMGDKPVTELAGIGPTLGKRLNELEIDGTIGFYKAYVVLGQFLVLKKIDFLFIDWLQDQINASPSQAKACYQCLKDWCDEFL